jgi:cytochrome c556
MRRIAATIGLAVAAFAATSAHADFAKPKQAREYREAAMEMMSVHFGRLAGVARGSTPNDPAQVKANAQVLQTLAALPWDAFGPGTEGGEAKPEVWSNTAGFTQKHQDFQGKVSALSAAADTGDLGKLKDAVGAVGASCKSCHDAFRKRD